MASVKKLRALLADTSKIIVCPGVYDGLTARIALNAGFECLYMVMITPRLNGYEPMTDISRCSDRSWDNDVTTRNARSRNSNSEWYERQCRHDRELESQGSTYCRCRYWVRRYAFLPETLHNQNADAVQEHSWLEEQPNSISRPELLHST